MAKKKKKTPSDYPVMAFRISQDEKDELTQLIEEAVELANAKLEEGEYQLRKNGLIAMALKKGFNEIIKRSKR